MKISEKGLALIKKYEGLHDGDLFIIGLQPKMCPAGIWTVGYGFALVNKNTGKWLKGKKDYHLIAEQYPEFLNMTIQQAEDNLIWLLTKYEKKVLRNIKIPLTQDQFDALVSHTMNTGGSSTLYKLINQRADNSLVEDWWTTRYITVEGKKLKGLILRRREEYELYTSL